VNFKEEIISSESRSAAINDSIDDVFRSGQVGSPVQLELIRDLLGVGASIDVDQQGVFLAVVEVLGKEEPDFGGVLASSNLDFQVEGLENELTLLEITSSCFIKNGPFTATFC